jgi:chromosome segregation ATPase
MDTLKIYEELKEVFGEEGAKKLANILGIIYQEVVNTVTKEEFKELKSIVSELIEAERKSEQRIGRLEGVIQELAEAQKRTEQRVEELAEAQKKSEERIGSLEISMKELAEAQKRTEQRVEELAEAQKRTEQRVEELAEAQKKTEIQIEKLTKSHIELRQEFGGFTKTMSYAFENEAYRNLPIVLKNKYNIEVKEKFIRTEIGNKEINIFGRGKVDGKEIYIVGEAKLRVDEKRLKKELNIFKELNEKVKAIKEEYGDVEIIKIIVTHFAPKKFIEKAKEENIIVIQSFEW